MEEEGLKETKHEKIHIAPLSDIEMSKVEEKLTELEKLLENTNNTQISKIKKVVKSVVPTYKERES